MAEEIPDRLTVIDGEADTATVAEYETCRRELVRRGLLASATVLSASSIPLLLRVRNAFGQVSGDAPTIRAAVGLEQVAVYAYGVALTVAHLDARTRALLSLLREHEQEHAGAMTSALSDVGGSPPRPPRSLISVDSVAPGLGRARNRAEVLTFAMELEAASVAAYHDAHRRLQDARTLQSAASIMGSEGQHLVLLRSALGHDPLPHAFEMGQR